MSYGVTSTGFVKPTLAELKAQIDAEAQLIWPGLDISGDGKYGQLIGLVLKLLSDAWDAAQEIYTSRDPNQATGASLDNIMSELGVSRIDASPTIAYGVLLWGDNGTLVSAGNKARQSITKQDWTLASDVTISTSTARKATFVLSNPSGSTTYTVTIDGTAYTSTSTSKDTAGSAIATAINAGAFGGAASYASGALTVDGTIGYFTGVDFAIGTLVNVSLDALASAGQFVCDTEGPIACPIGTLDSITTSVSGWDSVTNPLAGATGRNAETDSELRIRASGFYATGKATDEAIRQAVLNAVSGVVACSVTSNRTPFTDVESRPPKSFETLVEGGDDNEIAQVIWENAPAGIEIYGTTSVTVLDSQGKSQTVKFTRPSYSYIWVKVKRSFNSEESYPADGDALIKQKIVEWALETYNSGDNVYRRSILTPVNEVPGLADVTILLGNTTDGTTPSVYNASDISVPAAYLASFSVDRIIVEAL